VGCWGGLALFWARSGRSGRGGGAKGGRGIEEREKGGKRPTEGPTLLTGFQQGASGERTTGEETEQECGSHAAPESSLKGERVGEGGKTKKSPHQRLEKKIGAEKGGEMPRGQALSLESKGALIKLSSHREAMEGKCERSSGRAPRFTTGPL